MDEKKFDIAVDEGRGVLFERRGGANSKAPNMNGAFRAKRNINAGEKIDLVGWLKETRTGVMMVSFSEKTAWTPPEGYVRKTYTDRDGNQRRREPDAMTFPGDTDPDVPY